MAAKKFSDPALRRDETTQKTKPVELVQTVSDRTLEDTPARLLEFLRGASLPQVFVHLETVGYSRETHDLGWTLLQACGSVAAPVATKPMARNAAASAAIAAIDAWDEDGFRIVHASLKRRFPEVHTFLVAGIGASRGFAAVLGTETLLDRLDALAKPGAPTGAAEALDLLATRTITPKLRADLRAKIALAKSPGEIVRVDEASLAKAAATTKQALLGARGFYEEWSELARTAIKRRDYLIRLGLAHRVGNRTRAASADTDD